MNKLIERLERLKKVNPLLRNEWEAGFKDGKESAVETAISIVREMCEAGEVVVLPCKVGDDYYLLDTDTMEIEKIPHGVQGIVLRADGWYVESDGMTDKVGSVYCYLTEAEAQAEAQAECERRNNP